MQHMDPGRARGGDPRARDRPVATAKPINFVRHQLNAATGELAEQAAPENQRRVSAPSSGGGDSAGFRVR